MIMRNGKPPFTTATKSDVLYKKLAMNRADLYWRNWDRFNTNDGIDKSSEDFKDLLTTMLQYDPTQRLSLPGVIGHPWIAGDCANSHEVHEFMCNRFH